MKSPSIKKRGQLRRHVRYWSYLTTLQANGVSLWNGGNRHSESARQGDLIAQLGAASAPLVQAWARAARAEEWKDAIS